MKVTCVRESLLHAFQTAATIAPARSPKPILQNIKIEAQPDETILMATDMELGIRIAASDVEVETPGSAVLPVSRFGSLLRENSDEKLSISADGQGIHVKGERSEFNLPAHNPEEFPNVEVFQEEAYFEAPATLIKELIRRTLFATDTESSRYALGGVLLEFEDGKITAVGTDGRRLAKMEGAVSAVGGYTGSDSMTIVPSKSMQLIDRALINDTEAMVQIVDRPNDILIRSENATIYSRLVDGRFPKWRDVIPSGRGGVTIELTVGPIFSALRQASIVSSDESRGINFCFGKGSLVLSGQTADVGQSRVELPISYEGDEIVLSLDHRYLQDFLKVMGADKTFALNVSDGDSAALCTTEDGYSYVLMPLARDRVAKSA
jgi:DNA polymerase-3 subunit beta